MKRYLFLVVFISLINAGIAMAERLTVVVSVANIRSGPGSNHEILWQVEKYHPIFVIEKRKSWYHFKDFEDDKGWVHKSLVGKVEAVITKKDNCNIRSGPGTSEKILIVVEKGIPFKVLNHKGRWLHIEHADGDKGWLHDSLVW